MLKIDRHLSVILSYLFCAIALLGILALGALLIFDGMLFFNLQSNAFFAAQQGGFWIYVFEFMILGLVLLADILLMLLLNNVRKGRIFTEQSVLYLRMIAWASIFAGIAAVPLYFLIKLFSFLCLTFVGLFLGVILRVVKNVIEEGTAIREENDSTI